MNINYLLDDLYSELIPLSLVLGTSRAYDITTRRLVPCFGDRRLIFLCVCRFRDWKLRWNELGENLLLGSELFLRFLCQIC